MKDASDSSKVIKPPQAIKVLSKAYNFNETEKFSILENLIVDKDYSKWGVLNAVTKVANTTDDYDRASELENIGDQILTLNNSQWQEISEAA